MGRPKGSKMTESAKLKIGLFNKGKTLSIETKKKIGEKNKLNSKGNSSHLGFTHSIETKKILSEKNKGRICKPFSEEHRKRLSESNKGKVGEKSPSWKGGLSMLPYSNDWTNTLKESIRERDNYICQECGLHQDELTGHHKKLDIHHVDYNKENCDPRNLITLCKKCHIPTNFNREYWIEYFKDIFE